MIRQADIANAYRVRFIERVLPIAGKRAVFQLDEPRLNLFGSIMSEPVTAFLK